MTANFGFSQSWLSSNSKNTFSFNFTHSQRVIHISHSSMPPMSNIRKEVDVDPGYSNGYSILCMPQYTTCTYLSKLKNGTIDTWRFVWEIMKESRVWNDLLKDMWSKDITLVSECVLWLGLSVLYFFTAFKSVDFS